MHLRRFERRPLADNTREYRTLQAHFSHQAETKTLQVLGIDKVFNFKLDQRYKEHQQRVLSRHGPQCCEEPVPLANLARMLSGSNASIAHSLGLGEALLYHGCRPEALEQIVQNGFSLPAVPRSGCFFGKGIYFTDEPAKADAYVPKNEQ
eukprot:GEMP01118960.1.p1 GENE.GEMP01118960.1~~GEMP01118960.1.p1  ORF type:complete len:150 (+),score=31.30 GEMP01118960.1:77-526(+)